jgi:O-antigen/teichoic acid export membrane protein
VPYRPRLRLTDWRIFRDFLGWITLSQVAIALNWQSDQLLLGKLMRPAQLGLFSTASNLTSIPIAALFGPMLRPLLSAFSIVKHDPERLRKSYQTAASAMVIIGLPLLVGQSAVAGPMVMVLLGPKWVGAIPMVKWLSISLIPYLFGVLYTPLGMALGQTREIAWRDIVQLLVKLPMVVIGAIYYGFAGVVVARLVSETFTAWFCMNGVKRMIGTSIMSQFSVCLRAIISVLFMLGGLQLASPWLMFGPGEAAQLAQLILTSVLGAAIYIIFMVTLWRVAGQPDGFERTALRIVTSFWTQRRKLTAPT